MSREPIRLPEIRYPVFRFLSILISMYKLVDVSTSNNLIGSLTLPNCLYPPPGRWITCRVSLVTKEETLQMLTFLERVFQGVFTDLYMLIQLNIKELKLFYNTKRFRT